MGNKTKNAKQLFVKTVILILLACLLGFIILIKTFRTPEPGVHLVSSASEEMKSSDGLVTELSVKHNPYMQSIDFSTFPTESARTPSLYDDKLLASAEHVYYGVYFFKDDSFCSTENSEPTPSASVIKVFIMDFVYSLIEENQLSHDTTIQGQAVRTLVNAMIQHSDNNATNTLIKEFGMNTLNEYFASQGYSDTTLERLMLDYDAMAQGLNNYTSLDDTLLFLKTVYENKDTFPYCEMLEILKGQTVKTKIPALLPEGVVAANKTGEINNVQNDIGLVFSECGDFAVVILTNGCANASQTIDAIADFALQAYTFEANSCE